MHQAQVKTANPFNEPNFDETKLPTYAAAQAAMQTINQKYGVTQQGSSQNKVAQMIDEARQNGHSPEEIKAELQKRGLGAYISWVW